MKTILALILTVSLTACGQENPLQVETRSIDINGTMSSTSADEGTLSWIPRLPIEATGVLGNIWLATTCSPKEFCPPSPLYAKIIVTSMEGQVVTKGYSSAKDGSYKFPLATGTYWMTCYYEMFDATIASPKPILVKIPSGKMITVNFMFGQGFDQ